MMSAVALPPMPAASAGAADADAADAEADAAIPPLPPAAAGPPLPITCQVLGGQVCLFSAHAALWLQQHGQYGTPAFRPAQRSQRGARAPWRPVLSICWHLILFGVAPSIKLLQ